MLLVWAGCGDSIDGDISDLMAGGTARDEAYMELLFAKRYAVPALLDALENTEHPARGRADIADLLWKIYLRDSDPRIIDRLLNQIDEATFCEAGNVSPSSQRALQGRARPRSSVGDTPVGKCFDG